MSDPWTKFAAQKPPTGKLLYCTDGIARWLDIYVDAVGTPPQFGDDHVATHWFLLPDLPAPAAMRMGRRSR